jgi:hypothetical protein
LEKEISVKPLFILVKKAQAVLQKTSRKNVTVAGAKPKELQTLARFSPASIFSDH